MCREERPSSTMKTSSILSLTALALSFVLAEHKPASAQSVATEAPSRSVEADLATKTLKTTRVFKDITLDRPYKVTPVEGGYLLLDRGNHRLLFLGEDGRILKQISQLGQAPEELRHPLDFHLADNGRIYVATATIPFHVKIFRLNGEYEGGFSLGHNLEQVHFFTSLSITSTPQGNILLSQPRRDHLLTAYSVDGRELSNMGQKISGEEIHGKVCDSTPLCKDRRYQVSLNRVHTALDREGSIYVSFDLAPVIRKYSNNGEILFETHLGEKGLEEIVERQWAAPETWRKYYSYNYDGLQVLTLINGISIDPETGRVYCLVGSEEVRVLSPEGKQIAVLKRPQAHSVFAFDSISVRDGVGFLTNWVGVYRFEDPSL